MENKIIHIQSKNSQGLTKRNKAKVQLLPFKIHADCEAKVDKYFNNYVQTNEMGHLTTSFRGYPLKGNTIKVPDGYTGAIFYESKCIQEERKFFVINNFDEITYWNWSKYPSKNDTVVQALDWIDIAEALHSPITEE